MAPITNNKISAWKWFWSPSNFGVILPVSLILYPIFFYRTWGTSSIWVFVAMFVVTIVASIYHGIQDYKYLTENNYIKRFGEK